jgi:hypothetical protein
MVQTPAVEELKETANVELAVALNVGAVPKVCVPGLAKVIVCGEGPAGALTKTEAVDPTELSVVVRSFPAVSLIVPPFRDKLPTVIPSASESPD